MGRWLSFGGAVLLSLLIGCRSAEKGAGAPMLPPEEALESLTRIREFEFGVGDELDIFVWRQPALTRTAIVNPDGNISFALLGPVQVAGLTYSEFYDEMSGRVRQYIRDQYVYIAINVIRVTDEKIYVLGWVNDPGVYTWNSQMTVVEAIARAGGLIKDTAAPRSIFVASGDVNDIDMRIVDYLSIMRDGNFKENIPLQRGDIVYVPKQFMAHADKFFQRYASYFRALREGEFAIQGFPDMVDAASGDKTKRLRIITKRLQD